MKTLDWIITDTGECEPRPASRDWNLIQENYYLHQFLTEALALVSQARNEAEEWDYLPQIRQLVRKLLLNSYWVRTAFADPAKGQSIIHASAVSNIVRHTGSAIVTLYDEIGYPLTVQNVTFTPGTISPIHNHGTWGVIGIVQGQEKHTFWQRTEGDRLEVTGQKTFGSGEIISFMPGAIHQVEAIGDQPVHSFHIYGDTQPRARFEFDSVTHTAKHF